MNMSENTKMPITGKGLRLLLMGLVVMVAGFVLMIGGGPGQVQLGHV